MQQHEIVFDGPLLIFAWAKQNCIAAAVRIADRLRQSACCALLASTETSLLCAGERRCRYEINPHRQRENVTRLIVELQGQLQNASAAAIACDVTEVFYICEVKLTRVAKLNLIEHIECLGPELQPQRLVQ
jgi:hypothetical protein